MADRLWNLLMRFQREVVKPDINDMINGALSRFHRELVLPDIERIVDERLDDRVGALRDEMLTNFDGVYKRFDRLEDEYQSLSAAVRRIEDQHQTEN